MSDFDSPTSKAFGSAGRRQHAEKKFRVLDGGGAEATPFSAEAERQLLATTLIDRGDALARCVRSGLTPAAFWVPANRVMYRALLDMHSRGLPLELDVLAEELRRLGQLDAVGGPAYLVTVSGAAATTAQAAYFVERVRDLWLLREFLERLSEAKTGVAEYSGPSVAAHLAPFVLKFQRLVDYADRTARGADGLLERMRKRLERTRQIVAGKVDMSRTLTTGDAYMDGIFLPFDTEEEDWYVIVGGPPSGGKSSWMRWVALANIRGGKFCLVFILETGMRWLEQAAATIAKVNLRKRAEWPKDHLARYEAAYAELEGYVADGRLMVVDDVFNVEDMERVTREQNRNLRERQIRAGVPEDKARGLDFIVLDYLQLMGTRANQNGRWTREQVVSHCSRQTKIMLKSLDLVGFVGAQINRKGREDEDKPPRLLDLRESGAIEQDADRVIFAHTPKVNRAGMVQSGDLPIDEVEMHQRKSRNGPRDVAVGVLFEKQFTRYYPREDRPVSRPGLPKPSGGYGR